MQPAGQSPTREEHTNNPVQKPNFRGQGTERKETPKDQKSPRPRRYIGEDRPKRKPKAEVLPRGSRASKAKGDRRGKEAAVASGWRLSEGGRVLEVASLVNGRSHSQGSQSQRCKHPSSRSDGLQCAELQTRVQRGLSARVSPETSQEVINLQPFRRGDPESLRLTPRLLASAKDDRGMTTRGVYSKREFAIRVSRRCRQ